MYFDNKIHLIYEFYKGRTRTTTTTTIFKLIGPCEILSHGQKIPIFKQYSKLVEFHFISTWFEKNLKGFMEKYLKIKEQDVEARVRYSSLKICYTVSNIQYRFSFLFLCYHIWIDLSKTDQKFVKRLVLFKIHIAY